MQNIYKEINQNYEKLSEAEQEVIDFILKCEDINNLKLKDIKEVLFVSNATIIRACKKLNYSTFNELKYAFIRTREEKSNVYSLDSVFTEMIEGIKKDTLATLELVNEKEITEVCECILSARRICCVGTGSSSQVASDFNRKLKLIDLWSNDYLDKFSIERIAQLVTHQDVILVFSLSGDVAEINEVMMKAKSSGAKVIAITNIAPSLLKSLSDYSLQVYCSPSNRKKLRSRLMLYVMSTLLYEKLITKVPSLE